MTTDADAGPKEGTILRFATIGTGWITTQFADACRRTPGVDLTVVHSRDPARAKTFADRLGVAAWATDLSQLSSSDVVDAIYVASPNGLHHEQALAAIRAGKHVLVEKPATPTAEEFAQLVTEADDAGVVVMEAMRSAYDPGMVRVRQLIAQLGPLRLASLRCCKRSARYDLVLAGQQVNAFDASRAGGALNDLGVYCVSALVDLFGEPQRAVAATVPVQCGSDGAGVAVADYGSFVADLIWSKISNSDQPSEIQGEHGTLVIDSITAPRRLRIARADGTQEQVSIAEQPFDLGPELERFLQLCTGGDPTADHRRTLSYLRTLETLRQAAT